MNDFVFYKKRKFGDLISDTFTFFRKYAGNYFSNYLVINGAAIVSAGILFTVMAFFLPSLSGGFGTSLLLVLLMLVIVFFLFLFVFCFPIAYTELLEKNPNRTDIVSQELLESIKKMMPRAFLFGFISIFVIWIPYLLVSIGLASILGNAPFLLQLASYFLSTLLFLFMQQAMLLYIKDREGYFQALGKVVNQLKECFWDKFGATFVMNIICSLIVVAGAIIPLVIYFLTLAVSGFELGLGTAILVFVLLLIVVTVTFVSLNLPLFQQILIHLGEKENQHTDDIDLIGQNVEE
jgi:putative membrane protein